MTVRSIRLFAFALASRSGWKARLVASCSLDAMTTVCMTFVKTCPFVSPFTIISQKRKKYNLVVEVALIC